MRRSRLTQILAAGAGGVRHCHSHVEAATLLKSSFPTNSTTAERLAGVLGIRFHEKMVKQPAVKGHSRTRRPDKLRTPMGRRCPLTPTDPPGSVPAEFNDGVTKGVDPTVTLLA